MSTANQKVQSSLSLLLGIAVGVVLTLGFNVYTSEATASTASKNHTSPGSALNPTLLVYAPAEAFVTPAFDDGSMILEACGQDYVTGTTFPREVILKPCTALFGDSFENDHDVVP